MYLLMTYNITSFHPFGEYAYSLDSTHQNAYGLSAKHYHMFNMTAFLDGALDVLSRTIKRVYAMDGVYSGFAGAKTCLLRNLG